MHFDYDSVNLPKRKKKNKRVYKKGFSRKYGSVQKLWCIYILDMIKDFTVYIDPTSSSLGIWLKQKKVNKWYSEIADSVAVHVMVHVKCIRQLVQIAVRNVKFLSNRPKEDLCIVEIAIKNIKNSRLNWKCFCVDNWIFLFYLFS